MVRWTRFHEHYYTMYFILPNTPHLSSHQLRTLMPIKTRLPPYRCMYVEDHSSLFPYPRLQPHHSSATSSVNGELAAAALTNCFNLFSITLRPSYVCHT